MSHSKIIISRVLFIITVLLCVTLFISCKTLLFKSMFGSVTKVENIEDYEGYWESDQGFPVAIKFLNDSSTIVIGMLNWDKDKEMFRVENTISTITKVKDAIFLNFKKDNDYYDVYQFEFWKSGFSDRVQLRMWKSDIDAFERLVKSNELSGEIKTIKNKDGKDETDSIIVDSLSENSIVQIMEKNNMFDYKNVQILQRIIKPVMDNDIKE